MSAHGRHFQALVWAALTSVWFATAGGFLLAIETPVGDRTAADDDRASERFRALRLPAWERADVREFEENERPANLGGGLWPERLVPLEPEPPRLPPGTSLTGDLELPPFPEPPETPPEVPPHHLDDYFGARPERYLIDPQGLLPQAVRTNIERFLHYHASESSLDTVVLIFPPQQEFPAEISTATIWKRWFGDSGGAIIFYYLGEPNDTAIEFGRDLADQTGRARLQSLLDACVRDALETTDPGLQLERFCVKFSVQTYWLEKELGAGPTPAIAAAPAGPVAALADAGRSSPGTAVLVTLLACGLAGTGLWWVWSRRTFTFPEIDIPARLGGAHSGGGDTVLFFGKSSVPDITVEVVE